ncbi:MAG: helix-turn-helix transcriptional regulator [Microgenomates group bacterium]
MNYSRALKIIRAIKNLSQQELALKTSISKSLISRIESGERSLTKKNIQVIAERLSIPISLFMLLSSESKSSKLPEKDVQLVGKTLLSLLYAN